MYRVMLVDDEVYIVDGLSSYLKRRFADEIDILKAYAGEEAIAQANKMRLDIVVSDINMPGWDGFALQQAFATNWPACEFIFLTGHASFDYAYRVLQTGGARFLLKNEGYAKIGDTIEATMHTLAETQRQITYASPFRMSKEFEGYMESLFHGQPDAISPGGFRLSEKSLCLVALPDETDEKRPLRSVWTQLELRAQNLFQDCICAHSWITGRGGLAWLVQPAAGVGALRNWEHISRYVRGIAEALQTLCMEGYGKECSFAMTTFPIVAEDIAPCLSVLEHMICQKLDAETDRLQMRLLACDDICALQPASIRAAFWNLMRALYAGDSALFEATAACVVKWENTAIRKGLVQIARNYASHFEIETIADPQRSCPALLGGLRQQMAEARAQSSGDHRRHTIEAIHAYIEDHLSGQLSLSEIADHIHMNPSYLSRYYKKLCGKNLFDHITSVRILQAQKLLRKEKAKITDVAQAVGFSSIGYFSTVFKKCVGMSPQDFKRQEVNG